MEGGAGVLIIVFIVLVVLAAGGSIAFFQYRKILREAKNYERGLKMVPLLIHLPPATDDVGGNGRDERDVTEEALSQAQVMYSIISSTATKGFKSKVYGQRHMSFEIISRGGLVHYYVVVPVVLVDVIRQAVATAYPSARLEEVKENNIFSQAGRVSGTIGGEFTLKKSYIYPIATYQESKRDAARALLNAFSAAGKDDGIGLQFLVRPAREGWAKASEAHVDSIRKNGGSKKQPSGFAASKDIMSALWKPPTIEEKEREGETPLTSTQQSEVETIEEKTRYPAYEVLIRVVVSSNTAARSQVLLKNIVAAFSLFDSPRNNGFRFALTRNIDEIVTSYLMRFFPQELTSSVLNSVEMATLFHLPSQSNIPSSQVKRQMNKQVDGPTETMEEGLLVGYNEFRGTKKPIRVATKDRRRHVYIIGQTGVGKSVLQENMAYQDMMDGRGFAFIDPHGDLVESLLGKVPKERVEDVIYFNPSDMDNPIGLNMFEFDSPDQKDFLVQEAISMLYGLYDPGHTGIIGPRLEHIFRNCALLLMSDPQGGTFIDVPKCLIDPEFVKSKLKYVTDQTVLDFWTKEWPASQRSNEAGEVVSWVVSKFGPFISNDAMRNIIGQTKSGFNLRDIMDNKKILLVNLSKGRMGELNSKLLGIIFVMKFQAAAMGRADMLEQDRQDFSLYVDEFQNFATESFETIMSEARKYRLSLIMGNQFMTQLTDKIREAVIGNVGTIISGRIGVSDAELLVKKFQPTFDVDDLKNLPNFQSIASVMINNVPSAPFSMSWIPPMGQVNNQLRDALVRLSAAKYGRPRAQVEKEIFTRLNSGQTTVKKPTAPMKRPAAAGGAGGSSFLDDWLAKRKQMGGATRPATPVQAPGVPAAPAGSGVPGASGVMPAQQSVPGGRSPIDPAAPAAAPPSMPAPGMPVATAQPAGRPAPAAPHLPPRGSITPAAATDTPEIPAGSSADQGEEATTTPAATAAPKTHLRVRPSDSHEADDESGIVEIKLR